MWVLDYLRCAQVVRTFGVRASVRRDRLIAPVKGQRLDLISRF